MIVVDWTSPHFRTDAMRLLLAASVLILPGCASAGAGSFATTPAEERWEYVAAGTVNEVGNTLPAHVQVMSPEGLTTLAANVEGAWRPETRTGYEGTLIVFCDRQEMQYHFGESVNPSLSGGNVRVGFSVYTVASGWRLRAWALRGGGGWAEPGAADTGRFIDAASRGQEVDFHARVGNEKTIEHTFLLLGFRAALEECDTG
jgi:hypothetical protein